MVATVLRPIASYLVQVSFRFLCLQAMFLRNGRVCEDCLGRLPWRGVLHRCYHGSAPQTAVLGAMIGLHRAIGTYRRKVSRYIALTQFGRAKFIAGGLPCDRIAVKSNFAVVPVLDYGRPRSGGLFVGRLSPEKGIQMLARAAARHQGAAIEVIGTGPLRSSLETVGNLHLLGWLNQEAVYSKMREASYLMLPSIWYESFPWRWWKPFANGLPVVASRLGSMSEFVRDGETGLLFEAGNADDLAEKLAWADVHPREMARMQQR
jgi:glycosyltransferase involved in cell wall biosynthesis